VLALSDDPLQGGFGVFDVGAQGVPLLDNRRELQALFVQRAQLLGLRAQGGVLVGVVAVGQAVQLALDALRLALGLRQFALDGGQAAQFALERVRLLQGGLQGVQFGLGALLRFGVVGRDLRKTLFQVALLALQRGALAQFGVQLCTAPPRATWSTGSPV